MAVHQNGLETELAIDVREAIKRSGGPDRVAEALGIHRTAVYRWSWANALPGAAKLDRLRGQLAGLAGVKPGSLTTHSSGDE